MTEIISQSQLETFPYCKTVLLILVQVLVILGRIDALSLGDEVIHIIMHLCYPPVYDCTHFTGHSLPSITSEPIIKAVVLNAMKVRAYNLESLTGSPEPCI